MTAIRSFWSALNPYIKVAIGAITGGSLVVLAPLVGKQAMAVFTGAPMAWPALSDLGWFWLAACAAVGIAYWKASPAGKEIWTPEATADVAKTLERKP
jgi:hypothetical protein